MNRLLPGLALAVCWFLLLTYGTSMLFAWVLLGGLWLGAFEYGRMAFGAQSFVVSSFFSSVAILPLVAVWSIPKLGIGGGLVLGFLILSLWTLSRYRPGLDRYDFFCRASFGLLWVGLLGAHLLMIRQLGDGASWLLILSAITAGSDSGAYYIGRAWGRHKLSPEISPNKTIEGALGGIVAAAAVATLVGWLLLESVPWQFILTSALLLAVLGICGDLIESVVKRATGTKDSGTILGGHGGILDRADSILFAAPLLYYFLFFFLY